MRVRERVEELGKYHPDSPVLIDQPGSDFQTRREVSSVSGVHAASGNRDIELHMERQPTLETKRAVLISWTPTTNTVHQASASKPGPG